MADTFSAILVSRDADKKQTVETVSLTEADLMEGDVTVKVDATTVNYKDGLAITGKSPGRAPLADGARHRFRRHGGEVAKPGCSAKATRCCSTARASARPIGAPMPAWPGSSPTG